MAPRRFIMGKICSPVTFSDESGSWQAGILGAEHVMPRRLYRERGKSVTRLRTLAFEFVIAMMLLLKVTSKKKGK